MMDRKTTGTVISVKKQWWLKVNTKPIRSGTMDGAVFPSVIMVEYTVDSRIYKKKKWISAGRPVPAEGSSAAVLYDGNKPSKAKVL